MDEKNPNAGQHSDFNIYYSVFEETGGTSALFIPVSLFQIGIRLSLDLPWLQIGIRLSLDLPWPQIGILLSLGLHFFASIINIRSGI